MLLKSVLIGSVVAMSARLAVAAGEVEVAIDTSKLTESETKFETEFFNEVDADSNKLMSRRELKHYFVQQELGYGDEDLNMVVGCVQFLRVPSSCWQRPRALASCCRLPLAACCCAAPPPAAGSTMLPAD
jgi:hypothetical protein